MLMMRGIRAKSPIEGRAMAAVLSLDVVSVVAERNWMGKA
jgi:hypothetical protein